MLAQYIKLSKQWQDGLHDDDVHGYMILSCSIIDLMQMGHVYGCSPMSMVQQYCQSSV